MCRSSMVRSANEEIRNSIIFYFIMNISMLDYPASHDIEGVF